MQKKKKIGLSFTTTNYRYYVEWFKESDLSNDIEIVELSFEKNNLIDIHQCDGFILTGGVDIHPSFYCGEMSYENMPNAFQQERDVFEAIIFSYAQLMKLPVLGICRGLQLVNVLLGGKLNQDLGKADNTIHKKQGEVDKMHRVNIQPDTLLHQITNISSGKINSAHHQSINIHQLGKNLMVNAMSDEGSIIEGIEFKNKTGKGYLLCVQWHPERMENKEQSVLSENIKQDFLKAIRNTNMKKLDIVDPATEELITALTMDTKESLNEKVSMLRSGQQEWAKTTLAERIKIIKSFSDLLESEIEILSATLTSEVGKPLQQSRNEVNGARARIQWFTEHAEQYLSSETMSKVSGMEEKIVYEPLGLVCNISAWNYPYLVGTNVFIPALLAGNAVFYKPSEYSTLTGLNIERLLKKAGVPDNVFQVAIGDGEVGNILLDLPLDGYFFTGSYKTGQYIYSRVAPKMVVCQCELGGKDPLYVADDVVDIDGVAAGTADGAFYNNGQSCCSVERIYVHEKIYDQYVASFVKEVKSWKIGKPTEEGVYIGPLSRKGQLSFLESQVTDALAKGARLLTGGKRIPGAGYYFEPTVLVDVTHEMLVMKEESFGPIIGIMKVKNDEEAIKLMQDTEYGLTAAVYSSDRSRAEAMMDQLDAGTVYWNCCDRVSAALPWSGRKHSGFGATLSHAGLRAFTKSKGYQLRG
jgi:acyl-CoA reductase-like NAD-dependent aldehyde dehydrogenase/gamma-glutamyl-gamma-aminobutyrate hydrolase PuuD